jgi:DNA-binding NarL/FixJ family response regulator
MLDSKIVEPLVAAKLRNERSPLTELTGREREVLAEIAKGKSNSAIADTLVLTKRAVEKHINSIFLKLNLSNAEEISKRVKATLLFLANPQAGPADRPTAARGEEAGDARWTRTAASPAWNGELPEPV